MNESEWHSSPSNATLPANLAQRVDRICDRFEDAWIAGQRPRIKANSGGRKPPLACRHHRRKSWGSV